MSKSSSTAVVAILIGLGFSAGFTYLLIEEYIAGAIYAVLIDSLALVSLVIYGFPRLQELDLKNLRLLLREVKETKDEIVVKRKELEDVSLKTMELVGTIAAFAGIWGDDDTERYRRVLIRKQVADLISKLDLPPENTSKSLRYLEQIEAMQTSTGEERERRWNELKKEMKTDAES